MHHLRSSDSLPQHRNPVVDWRGAGAPDDFHPSELASVVSGVCTTRAVGLCGRSAEARFHRDKLEGARRKNGWLSSLRVESEFVSGKARVRSLCESSPHLRWSDSLQQLRNPVVDWRGAGQFEISNLKSQLAPGIPSLVALSARGWHSLLQAVCEALETQS